MEVQTEGRQPTKSAHKPAGLTSSTESQLGMCSLAVQFAPSRSCGELLMQILLGTGVWTALQQWALHA